MLRRFAVFPILVLTSLSWGQGPGQVNPESVSPQVVINIRKHPIGADLVEITVAEKGYPLDVLRAQAEKMAANLGSEARGLSAIVSGYDPKFQFAKASFATDGIIERTKGEVRLNAIVRGMLEVRAPKPIKSFLITLENEAPVDKQTLRSFESKGVVLKAQASDRPKSIEYRILVLTDDATQVDIPDRFVAEEKKQEVQPQKKAETPNWMPIALIVVAGTAGGALVYLMVSGRSPRAKERPVQRK